MVNIIDEELFYRIALSQTGWIGDKMAQQLLHHFDTAKDIFAASSKQLAAIDGFGAKKVNALKAKLDSKRIEQEMAFIEKHKIDALFYSDLRYPQKLKSCADAPVMLYYKGNCDLNAGKMVSIIGTRKNTDYGQRITEELVDGLRLQQVTVVSGLASGIDIIAHKRALQSGTPTIGVMAHGLDTIYPSQHKHIAKDMIRHGGLLTEYISGTAPDRYNFPMRNRIVAGMSDVTVVVETQPKGGAMITAKLATSYNREVAAFPGRTIDTKSGGCNYLIRTNMAQLITCAADLMEMMNWETVKTQDSLQPKLFHHLTDDEMMVAAIINDSGGIHIDELFLKAGIPTSRLAALLLTMELGGVVKCLPGKRYRLS